MAKTVEAYVRAADPATVARDAEFFDSPGSKTEGLTFVPQLYMQGIAEARKELGPIFGLAADQVVAADKRLLRASSEDMQVCVASGICPFPMDYNAVLNPTEGPGTARWYDAETRRSFVLPQDITAAVWAMVANQPPLT